MENCPREKSLWFYRAGEEPGQGYSIRKSPRCLPNGAKAMTGSKDSGEIKERCGKRHLGEVRVELL
jgi:hypothetical protein